MPTLRYHSRVEGKPMKTKYQNLGNDEILIEDAKAGDRSAFEELIDQYRDDMLRLAVRRLRNVERAQDVVQEATIKAFRAMGGFESGRPFLPWLLRICANCCVDHTRQNRSDMESLDRVEYMLYGTNDSPEVVAERADVGSIVDRAIRRLPNSYKTIVLMHHFDDKKVSEIARELNKPEGTVKSWLFRARALLRKELSGALLAS